MVRGTNADPTFATTDFSVIEYDYCRTEEKVAIIPLKHESDFGGLVLLHVMQGFNGRQNVNLLSMIISFMRMLFEE